MALPPNEFKNLLVGSDVEIYDVLRKKGLLSEQGLTHGEDVLEVIRAASQRILDSAKEHPGRPGPNQQDYLAAALLGSPYVNATAKIMATDHR